MQKEIPVECDPVKQMGLYHYWRKSKDVNSFLKSEAYATMYLWNELYQLPYRNFLVKFLQRLGVKEKSFTIKNLGFEPKLHLNKTPVIRPDVLIQSDKNVVVFEFKNSEKKGKFQKEQIPREYFAGLKIANGKPVYLILVTDEEFADGEEASVMIDGKGRKIPWLEIEDNAKKFLRREKELKKPFEKHFSKDKIIVISWRKFRNAIYIQLGSSKKHAGNKDLEDIYDRVMSRIKCFVQTRKGLYSKI